jgi:hypothetical protein
VFCGFAHIPRERHNGAGRSCKDEHRTGGNTSNEVMIVLRSVWLRQGWNALRCLLTGTAAAWYVCTREPEQCLYDGWLALLYALKMDSCSDTNASEKTTLAG